jgi:hypothetical protein
MKMVFISSVNTVLLSLSENVLGYLQQSSLIYSHGIPKISNLMNRFLHEFLDLTVSIILTVLFCKVNIMLLLGELTPKKYSIFHYGMEIGKIN